MLSAISSSSVSKSKQPAMTVEKLSESEGYTFLQRLELILNVIAQMIIGFVALYMCWFCFNLGLYSTVLHAWLVTIGFVLLMAEGIMCHYNGNILTFGCTRRTKTTAHSILLTVGGLLGIAGILVECIPDKFELETAHSRMGFAAFILCCVCMLSGLSALLSTNMKRLLRPLLNKTFHNFLGLTTYVIAMAAQILGYQTGLFTAFEISPFCITCQVLTSISTILVCIGPIKGLFSKLKSFGG